MAGPAKLTPPPSPPSPSASYYDISDDEESEYNTIAHSSSGRGVKLLFSKSKVYIHPTPSAKDNIPGFIALLQQKPVTVPTSQNVSNNTSGSLLKDHASSYLLAWVPESAMGDAYDTYVKVDLSENNSPPRQSYLVPALPTMTTYSDAIGMYAFAVPLSEIYSLWVRPTQSWVVKRRMTRESFDPFSADGSMFWGGDEVLRWVRRYADVQRAGADPSKYLINPSEEDKLSFGHALGSKSDATKGAAASSQAPRDAAMDPITKALKETRWKVLEGFSRISTFTRRTANDLAENPIIPTQVRRLMKNPEIQTLQNEFDSARIYLARWAMNIAEQSERERNQRIWTAQDMLASEDSSVGEFEILELETGTMSLQERRKPVTLQEWNSWFNSHDGHLQITVDEVKERIFHGGLDPNDGVRKEAWLFLLGVYQWNSSEDDRRAVMNSRRDQYVRLKGAWWEMMVDGDASSSEYESWKEQKARIEKDVHRTDRTIPLFSGEDIPHPDPDSPFADAGTNVHLEQMKDMLLTYHEYNPGLGYVQGMSDLLAPIYAVMQDDAVAFWGFVGFMERMERNFLRDQSGMRAQLLTLDHLVQLMDPQLYLHLQSADSTNFFFFFRMLLVWYKREFEWGDILRLWETLWTNYYSGSFHLFIALAILEKHRDVIMDHLKHFDEVLKYINELSNTMELIPILTRAESLFRRFERVVQAVDKKNNFPMPRGVGTPSDSRSQKRKSPSRPTDNAGQEKKERVISPELRQLLSRENVTVASMSQTQQAGSSTTKP